MPLRSFHFQRLIFLIVIASGFTPILTFAQTSVLTYRNDNMRTGQNLSETLLTPSNVQSTSFGKLLNLAVDGHVDAQPLIVPGMNIGGMTARNVVFAATEHDSIYAFDADTGTNYWKVSLLGAGETTSDARGCGQVTPEIGITGTPVIDLHAGAHGIIYAVAMTRDAGGGYHQRLHALDITTGAEQLGGPVEVHATYPGNGDNSSNGSVVFDAKQYKSRPGILLVNGVIYTSWGSHCDFRPYTGWAIGYDQTTLAQTGIFNFAPNGNEAGIWGAGGGSSADSSGNLFFDVANGTFDTTLTAAGFPNMGDYGNAFVKVAPMNASLTALDYWTMDNTVAESNVDEDLGSGGVLLIPDVKDSTGTTRHLGTGAGKDANIYVFDRDNMGKFNSANNSNLYQELPKGLNGPEFASPAWFNGNLYYGASGDVIRAFKMTSALLGASPTSTSATSFTSPGTSPSVSANGATNGILWAVENTSPAVLHAYDATNLATELYNSNQAPANRDHFGNGNKFITPIIANGKVFVGTPNSVAVFGLLAPPSVTLAPSAINFQNQTVNTASSAQAITLTNGGPNALTVSSIGITGANPGDFSQTNNCPLSPATIAVNGSCTINVTFTPSVANMRSAAVTITDNGNGNPQAASLSGTGTGSGGQTWPNGYNYEATFTVSAGQAPSAQANFPALISGTFADFATVASGGKISNTCTQAVGNSQTPVPCDLIFTSDPAGTTLVNWEFETYTAATGAVNIWVNVPSLANGTVVYAWYGKSSVTTLQTAPAATWGNSFLAVYHLKENPAGGAPQLNDSTANANHATMNGAVQASQQQSGEIDGSLNFEGNTWAGLANPANFNFDRTDSFSISGWFKIPSNSAGTLLSKLPATPSAGWGLLQFTTSSTPAFALGLIGGGSSNAAIAETPAVSTGGWHYVVATYAGTGTVAGMSIYVDGVNQPLTHLSDNLTTSIINAVTPAINGRSGPNQMSPDSMDELRVSSKGVVFPADWVTASYNNQSHPATFFTVATGLSNSGGSLSAAPPSVNFPSQTVNTTSGARGVTLTNNGSSAVTLGNITITGSNSGDFAQTNNCPASPATLGPGGVCTINVTFTPAAAGARSAALSIPSNANSVSVGLSGTGAGNSQPWPNGYNYQATFTVAAGKAPSAQVNFPTLISGTFADLAAAANGGKVSNTCMQTVGNNSIAVPCDLIFTSDAAGTTLLKWEFETYNAATGAVNIWVNVPNLSSGTVIYAWYGKAAVTTLQTTPAAVWNNNYTAVYHLKENPAGPAPQMNDSTANANHATMNGPVQAGQQQPGEIDGSLNFEGNTWASLANPANFNFERTDSFSLSGWFRFATNSAGTLISKLPAVPSGGWALLQFTTSTSPGLALGLIGSSASNAAIAETPAIGTGAWHYVVATYSGTSTVSGIHIYVDGVNQPLTTVSNGLTTSILNTVTPAINGRGGPNQMTSDSLDEVRISAKGIVFSADWATTSNNNQSQPATFFTVSTGLSNTASQGVQ